MLGGMDPKGDVATISHLQFVSQDQHIRPSREILLSFYHAQGVMYGAGIDFPDLTTDIALAYT